MMIKDSVRTCKCKYCSVKFTMFAQEDGELIFFPRNTVRPTLGYYELLYHLKRMHPEIYNLYSYLTKMFKENVVDSYVIS